MHVAKFIQMWILCISWVQGSNKPADKKSHEVNEFFNQIENVMNNVMDDTKVQEDVQPDPMSQKYSISKYGQVKEGKSVQSYYDRPTVVAYTFENFLYDKPVNNIDETERRNAVMDFEGYQEFVFRPLYTCDHYDSSQRYCVFFRQLGTTLTLGVYMGQGQHRGMQIYWYRCLKKKYSDNIIKEPLKKNFLPWNLNLGGTGNELRISPITEMDLGNNYFVAELMTPRAYQEKYGKKPAIRFTIEPISIDMGSLYHGEEIVIYARSFVELPRRSVTFRWSLFDSKDFDDQDLPSNMRLSSDKSTVVIKELKTYQDQILACKAYSNKEVLLARRNFLFKGFTKDNNDKSNPSRHKRSSFDTEGSSRSKQIKPEPGNLHGKGVHNIKKSSDNNPFEWYEAFSEIPEVPVDLFYENEKNPPHPSSKYKTHTRSMRSNELNYYSSREDSMAAKNLRKFTVKEPYGSNKFRRSEEFPAMSGAVLKNNQPNDKPRFEDVDSQTIATCQSDSDCNIYAICISAPVSGQKYCQCRHTYNGNGLFCFKS